MNDKDAIRELELPTTIDGLKHDADARQAFYTKARGLQEQLPELALFLHTDYTKNDAASATVPTQQDVLVISTADSYRRYLVLAMGHNASADAPNLISCSDLEIFHARLADEQQELIEDDSKENAARIKHVSDLMAALWPARNSLPKLINMLETFDREKGLRQESGADYVPDEKRHANATQHLQEIDFKQLQDALAKDPLKAMLKDPHDKESREKALNTLSLLAHHMGYDLPTPGRRR